jgi:DNA-binding response OmpR family regulator
MLAILIAEDDKQLGRALELYLGSFGFDALLHETAEDVRRAAISRNGDFVFALVDYQLGEDSGIELSRWLLDRYPNLSLVLMSGFPPDEQLDITGLGDRAIFLQKPFHPKDVISCFRTLRPLLMMSV